MIKELIFEELSISDEVVDVSQRIIDEINVQANNYEWINDKIKNVSNLFVKDFTFNNIKELDITLIVVRLINFSTIEEMQKNIIHYYGDYIYNGFGGLNILIFSLPCINYELLLKHSIEKIQFQVDCAFKSDKSDKKINNNHSKIYFSEFL